MKQPYEPGSIPGWGMSWWYAEQGLLDGVGDASPAERLRWLFDYFDAVGDGWEPSVGRERWAPYHPWDPDH